MFDDLLLASDVLRSHSQWHIFTHRKADGDAIGSANALFEAGVISGHSVNWSSPDTVLPEVYCYMPHFSKHYTMEKLDCVDDGTLCVFLDCANQDRSVSSLTQNINSLNIDHHEDNSHYGRVNCVDGKSSSTCELLYRILKAGGWTLNINIAQALYTGIFTDSGSFTFSNTGPTTHTVAAELITLGAEPGHMTDLITQNKSVGSMKLWGIALSRVETFGPENIFALSRLYAQDFTDTGADMTETEGLPAFLMSIRGVKFAVTITEYPNGTKRVSFRSREGSPFNAGEVAREFGGGGHERASGASFNGSVDEACNSFRNYLLTRNHELPRAGQ